MVDIFVSYSHQDEMRIREVVCALEGQNWSVFWDRRIPAGQTWQSYIGQALSDAKCVIVAWSHHSINSEWVIEEANDAKDRGILIPIFLDSVKPPIGFRGIQAADLTGWKPGYSSPHFDQLIQDIAGVAERKAHQTPPDKVVTSYAEPLETSRAKTTELPPRTPAVPKPESLKAQIQELEASRPRSVQMGKKRKNFLIGLMIVLALGIVMGVALWFPRDRGRPPEPKANEPPVAKGTTQQTSTNSIGMSFVLIPAGSFVMGSPTREYERIGDEQQHPVTINKPFYLQTTEVTQKQWRQVMLSNPSGFKECGDDCPVENVSWDDAQEFIRKLNQMEFGAKYRLPTEAEWEYACRAGTSTRFYTGVTEQDLDKAGWYRENSGGQTHPVAEKTPNAMGLYDMHGSVWEWVEDDWHNRFDGAPADGSAWTENPRGSHRVLRGGSWNYDVPFCRSAARIGYGPSIRSDFIGFRLARSAAIAP